MAPYVSGLVKTFHLNHEGSKHVLYKIGRKSWPVNFYCQDGASGNEGRLAQPGHVCSVSWMNRSHSKQNPSLHLVQWYTCLSTIGTIHAKQVLKSHRRNLQYSIHTWAVTLPIPITIWWVVQYFRVQHNSLWFFLVGCIPWCLLKGLEGKEMMIRPGQMGSRYQCQPCKHKGKDHKKIVATITQYPWSLLIINPCSRFQNSAICFPTTAQAFKCDTPHWLYILTNKHKDFVSCKVL